MGETETDVPQPGKMAAYSRGRGVLSSCSRRFETREDAFAKATGFTGVLSNQAGGVEQALQNDAIVVVASTYAKAHGIRNLLFSDLEGLSDALGDMSPGTIVTLRDGGSLFNGIGGVLLISSERLAHALGALESYEAVEMELLVERFGGVSAALEQLEEGNIVLIAGEGET